MIIDRMVTKRTRQLQKVACDSEFMSFEMWIKRADIQEHLARLAHGTLPVHVKWSGVVPPAEAAGRTGPSPGDQVGPGPEAPAGAPLLEQVKSLLGREDLRPYLVGGGLGAGAGGLYTFLTGGGGGGRYLANMLLGGGIGAGGAHLRKMLLERLKYVPPTPEEAVAQREEQLRGVTALLGSGVNPHALSEEDIQAAGKPGAPPPEREEVSGLPVPSASTARGQIGKEVVSGANEAFRSLSSLALGGFEKLPGVDMSNSFYREMWKQHYTPIVADKAGISTAAARGVLEKLYPTQWRDIGTKSPLWAGQRFRDRMIRKGKMRELYAADPPQGWAQRTHEKSVAAEGIRRTLPISTSLGGRMG